MRAFFASATLGTAISLTAVAGGITPAQFGTATNFLVGSSSSAIAVGDFDRDKKNDIAVIKSGGISILLNSGRGAFAAPTNLPIDIYQGTLAVADFNNDGNQDIVVAGNSSSSYLKILLGDGNGNFQAKTNTGFFLNYSSGMATGDFNGDGNCDLAIVNNYPNITIAFGQGNGLFNVATKFTLANNNSSYGNIRVADVYGNGKLSLVVPLSPYASSNCFCVLSNKGDGTFAGPFYYADSKTNSFGRFQDIDHCSLALGDFNGNGKLDIAVLNWNREYANSNSVTIWINDGQGTFVPSHEYLLDFPPSDIANGDCNGDGTTDLVVYGQGTATVLVGNGDSTFTAAALMTVTHDSYNYGTALAVEDFDGNRTPDLAFINYTSSSVAIMLNQTPPILQITPRAGYNQLSWLDTFGDGFTLEHTTYPLKPSSWQPFPYPPVLIGNQKAVTDWTDGNQRFYRLRKP